MATPVPGLTHIDQLRRMTAEPLDGSGYSDADLTTYLQRYPLPDSAGAQPADATWTGVWDANRAAADVWEEKAALYAADFDFAADGGNYQRSQVHSQMLTMARLFRSRRSTSALVLTVQPKPAGAPGLMDWLGNAPEDSD